MTGFAKISINLQEAFICSSFYVCSPNYVTDVKSLRTKVFQSTKDVLFSR